MSDERRATAAKADLPLVTVLVLNMGSTSGVCGASLGGPIALASACRVAAKGGRTGDIGATIQSEVQNAGLTVVRDFVGYAMGQQRIQEPKISGVGKFGQGQKLRKGQLLHVHVIAKHGSHETVIEDSDWTATSADGRLSAVFTAIVEVDARRGRILSRLLHEADSSVVGSDTSS